MSALIDTGQIAEILCCSVNYASRMTREPGFPAPVERQGIRGKWDKSAVRQWLTPIVSEDFDIDERLAYEASVREQRERAKVRTMRQHLGMVYRNAKRRCREDGRVFAITQAEIIAMHDARPSCAVSGMPFSLERTIPGQPAPFAPSLDRIDNAKGYEIENLRMVCCAVNYLMNAWGDTVFHRLAEQIRSQK